MKNIKAVSKTWNITRFSKYFEDLEKSYDSIIEDDLERLREILLKPDASSLILENDRMLRLVIPIVLKELTRNQQQVIVGTFYLKKSSRKLAEKFGINHRSILKTKDRALLAIIRILMKPSFIQTIEINELREVFKKSKSLVPGKFIDTIKKTITSH